MNTDFLINKLVFVANNIPHRIEKAGFVTNRQELNRIKYMSAELIRDFILSGYSEEDKNVFCQRAGIQTYE